ncbi:hypothetical protein CEXT_679481 [Caerostris extrusa]|uniref:Uncharacterized protein n=1 Tax=Caerostris extrusa TaxID=172846 RepID=A0AAV4YAV9_CAEEX|nr:hypothetical protein CEXT_679481 [Caerostris extrusa]
MQPISPRRANALPFIQYSQRVGHSFGHVEQTPPSPKRDRPPDAQAPSISLIHWHLQPATDALQVDAPLFAFLSPFAAKSMFRPGRS